MEIENKNYENDLCYDIENNLLHFLSEKALSSIWLTPEEDEAWKNL